MRNPIQNIMIITATIYRLKYDKELPDYTEIS